MRFRSTAVLSAAASAAFVVAAGPLFSQGIITGSITGTVQDPSGAVVAGAQVVATSPTTGVKFTEKSNGKGDFTFPSIPVGVYTITISAPGFSDLNLENIQVSTGQATGLSIQHLSTGSASESVEVNTGQSLLETVQSQVTNTFTSEQIQDLPTGGGLDQLALLSPGVVGNRGGSNFSNTNGVGISSNGQRGRSNNFELDGQSNNDNSVAGEQIFFENQDALAEIQVITNNFGAQYGRNMGSVINYVTKSGTNQIHGTAFEYYTGSFISSLTQGQKSEINGYCQPGQTLGTSVGIYPSCYRTPFKPRFTDNTFGGTIGFPILKDKLWGFGSALRTVDKNGLNSVSSTRVFPTQTGISQLQAGFPGNPAPVSLLNQGPYGASSATTLIANVLATPQCAIASTTVTTTYSTALGACTNGGVAYQGATFTRTYHPANFDEEWLGRLDYQITPKDRTFLRYFYQNAPGFGGGAVSGSYYNTTGISHSVGADWSHTFGPHWVNDIRYSFQQSTFNFDGGGFPTCTVKNLSGCPSTLTFSATNLSYGYASNIPQGRTVKVTQVQDNANWTLGRHSITFGGEFDYQNSPNVFLPYINGGFTFANLNAMLAQSGTVILASGASPNLHFTEPDAAAYIQDDWKVTPALTLNMGLRYEFFGQSLNTLHNISLAEQTGSTPQWNTSLPLSQTTFPYINPHKLNFEPRVGFAYSPTGLKKLVVRGGFAINFDPAYYNIALNSFSAAPIVNQSSFACNGNCLPAAGTYNAAVHAKDDALNPSGGNPGAKSQTQVTPKFGNPYAESFTLGFQYEVAKAAVVEVRYAGNHTMGNFQTFNANPLVGPGTTSATVGGVTTYGQGSLAGALVPALSTYFPQYAGAYCTSSTLATVGTNGVTAASATSADLGHRYCGSTTVRTRGNTAWSIYNSLQTQLTTRNLYGFTGSAQWTYGRQEDNSSEVFSTSGGGNTVAFAQNPFDIDQGERGLGGFSYKNVTSVGLTYSVPKRGNKIVRALGGLELNTLYTFNSGQPYTPAQYYYSLIGYYYSLGYLPAQIAANGGSVVAPTGGINANAVTKGRALFSLCDYNFNNNFTSYDVCRPFVGNPNAPQGTVAFNTGNGYIDANGNPIQRNQARLVINNANEAIAQGTPYGNMGRNTFLGDSYNNVNFGAFKDFRIKERYTLQMQVTLFNALNRGYYGTPDVLADDAIGSSVIGSYSTFQNFSNNSGSAVGPATGSATGARNIQLGAKFLF